MGVPVFDATNQRLQNYCIDVAKVDDECLVDVIETHHRFAKSRVKLNVDKTAIRLLLVEAPARSAKGDTT